MGSSFILNLKSNAKNKDIIRCEFNNNHLGLNVYLGLEERRQEAGRRIRTLGPQSRR